MSTTELPASSSALPGAADHLHGPRDLAALHRDVWKIVRENPVIFVLFPALVWFPFDLLSELAASALAGDDFLDQLRVSSRVSRIGELVAGTFVSSVVLVALRDLSRGHKPSLMEAIKGCGPLWGRVFGTGFLAGLLVGLGLLALIIPGLILAARWALALPVVAFEGQAGMVALRRSQRLTQMRGTFTIFGYGLAAYLVYFMLSLVPTLGVSLAGELLGFGESAVVNALFTFPFNVLMTALIVGVTLVYFDVAEQRATYPVGLDLVDETGRRVPAPRGTGAPGLALAAIPAALMLVVTAGLAWFALEEEAAFGGEPAAEYVGGEEMLDEAMVDELLLDEEAILPE